MTTFKIPLHFEDLSRSSAGEWRVRSTTLRETPAEQLLEQVAEDPLAVLNAATSPTPAFTALYTLITHYASLPKPARPSLVDFANTLVDTVTPTNPAHIKIASYFLSGLCATASSTSPPCKYWEKTGRESTLETLSRLASCVPTSSSFPPADLDQISTLLVRTVLQVLEQPSAARDRYARPVLSAILAAALNIHEQQRLPAVSALLHALNRHEHLPAPLADILSRMSEENEQLTQFVAEFVREITRIPAEDLARDTTSAKGCAAFIGDLAERMPNVFRSNLALVLSQLDGESYTMRNGVVHVIAVLIRTEPNSEDPLLEVLMERAFRDVNAFTRSKALQMWIGLAEARLIPTRLFHVLADMAASRLEDKTAAVRKYAAQLLSSLLQNNPFGPSLRISHFKEKLAEFGGEEDSEQLEEEAGSGKEATLDGEGDGDPDFSSIQGSKGSTEEQEGSEKENESSNIDRNQDEKIGDLPLPSAAADEEVSKDDSEMDVKRRYYSFAVGFIRSVEMGLGTVYNMLRSKSITDVSEAVSLLITAVQFQLEAAAGRAVRKMLPLVLARESNIRQATVNAYVRLLAPGGVDSLASKESAMSVATGLAALAVAATTGELACLEALISAMFASEETSGVISSSVVAVLWDIFEGKVPGATDDQRRAACMLVGMIGAERSEYLQQKIQIIESIGLSDPSFARWSCVALCKLPPGFDSDGRLSERLASLCLTTNDLSTIEQAINAVFTLSSEPELVVGSIIRDLSSRLHENAASAPVSDLCRFLQVIGHVAIKELVRIEALISQVRKSYASQGRSDENNEEDEQASAEADKALELAEKELSNPASLLGRYGNLARKIASDRSAPPELQASAVLCMAKLMCVQEKYCETNLRLLFSILSSASDPAVRSNAVTALGDLAFRFPNLVEPWSSHIYSALQDKDDQVRKNTLMALTHLILNDMVKVKGQIVNLAICILDKNDRIADLARLFFHELARKSTNAIYNILPDTISCMSRMENLKSEDFKAVVSFLIGLMDKEKHADGMVEKLCHRFRTNETERENRDLAYCIAQLNMSERGVKKMNDAFKSFSSAICDDVVYEHIVHAISKGNRNNANTTSEAAEELKTKIDTIRKSAAEAEATEAGLQIQQRSEAVSIDREETVGSNKRRVPSKRRTRTSNRRASRKARERVDHLEAETTQETSGSPNEGAHEDSSKDVSESDSYHIDEGQFEHSRVSPSPKARRRAAGRRKVVVQESDDNSSGQSGAELCDDTESEQSSSGVDASDDE